MNDHVHSEELAAYVDGLLETARKNELEKHFARCPQCLAELADLSIIMGGKDKVPARLFEQVLGGKGKPARVPLRLVFEVAAALLVVVFIGYFFLSGNRIRQTVELPGPLEINEQKVRRAEPPAPPRERELALPQAQKPGPPVAAKTMKDGPKISAAPQLSEATFAADKENTIAGKEGPADESRVMQAAERGDRLPAGLEGPARPAVDSENPPKKERVRRKTVAAPVGGAALDLAGAEEAAAASMAVKAKGAAARPEDFCIEGDAGMADLLNPELLSGWTWLLEGMVLELQIDGAGVVIAVSCSQDIDPLVCRRAESEAAKLLFSVSDKKTRRSRLRVRRPPAN